MTGFINPANQTTCESFRDSGFVNSGPPGPQGVVGPQGPQGVQGVSVTDAAVEDGDLILILSNGQVINAGFVGGGGNVVLSNEGVMRFTSKNATNLVSALGY